MSFRRSSYRPLYFCAAVMKRKIADAVSCDHLLCSLSRVVLEVTINQQARRRIHGANEPGGEQARGRTS